VASDPAVDSAVGEYFEAAQGWDRDRARAEQRSALRAWWVAAIAVVVAVVAVGAVAALTPLKRVEPFVIRVDNTSGVVDVVPALAGTASETQAVTRYLVTQYVITRERYVAALAESDYETVGAFHGAALNQAWAALWNRNNPDSPLNRHADGSSVRVQVLAVSFLKPGSGREDLVQLRFARFSGEPGNERESRYVATLQYAYGPPSKDDRLRALNPLGFKVLEYRREPEVMGVGVTPGASS
jgi:type IV secretion system protein VirB8